MASARDAEKIEEYREYWRRREARHEADLAIRRAEGRRLAMKCAEVLAVFWQRGWARRCSDFARRSAPF